jgi:hypothetical protein
LFTFWFGAMVDERRTRADLSVIAIFTATLMFWVIVAVLASKLL